MGINGRQQALLMKPAHPATNRSVKAQRFGACLHRTVVLLLLLAIPGLSTLAKNSWYLPQSDTGHYLTGAIKLKVAHSPILLDREPLRLIAKVAPPPPRVRTRQQAQPTPALTCISLTISLQHRSPPPSLT
jgi:hypothetical protein